MAKEKSGNRKEAEDINLVRILGKDIRGDKKLFSGIKKIKGVSWSFSNAICKILNLDKEKQVQDLTKEEIEEIEQFIKDPKIPSFMKNRQKDFDDGEDKHLSGEDLKLRREFDIKRLRKIKSYKGIRHGFNLPVRGQRTKANFRKNRKKSGAVEVKKKK